MEYRYKNSSSVVRAINMSVTKCIIVFYDDASLQPSIEPDDDQRVDAPSRAQSGL